MGTVSLRHFDVSLTPRHQSEFGALKVRFVWGRGARGMYNYKKLQKKVLHSFLEDTLPCHVHATKTHTEDHRLRDMTRDTQNNRQAMRQASINSSHISN